MVLFWLRRLRPSNREMLRLLVYAAMDAVAVLSNFGSRQLAEYAGAALVVAGPVGYLVGGQVNFFLHNGVTWRDRHPTMRGWQRRWVLYMTGNIAGLIVNTAAVLIYAELGMPEVPAFFAALSTSAVVNWIWNYHVTFAQRPLNPPDEEGDSR